MSKSKHIRVRGERRQPTDLRKLSQALILLAQAQAEADAEAEQAARTAKKPGPKSPSTPSSEDQNRGAA